MPYTLFSFKTRIYLFLIVASILFLSGCNSKNKPADSTSKEPKLEHVYFVAKDGTQSRQLWKTDGTSENTTTFTDKILPAPGSNPGGFLAVGNKVFFTATDKDLKRQVWKIENNIPTRVTNLFPGANPYINYEMYELNGKALFIAADYNSNANLDTQDYQLYATDGSNTTLLAGGNPEISNISLLHTKAVNGRFLYTETKAGIADGLWSTNGSTVSQLNSHNPINYWSVILNNKLYYFVSTPLQGSPTPAEKIELWETDGITTQVTTNTVNSMVKIRLGYPVELNQKFYFSLQDGTGDALWVMESDTNNGVKITREETINPNGSAGLGYQAAVAGKLYFIADNGVNGAEPMVFDPTLTTGPKIKLIKDLTVNGNTSSRGFIPVGDSLYFGYYDSSQSPSSRYLQINIALDPSNPGFATNSSYSGISQAAELAANFYFIAYDAKIGVSLYRKNGQSADIVKTIWPYLQTANYYSGEILQSLQFKGALYFMIEAPDTGRELWTSDGTTDGTHIVKDIFPGSIGSWDGNRIGITSTALYFSADDGNKGAELWTSDGTTQGTILLGDLNTGPTSARNNDVSPVFYLNNKAFFFATPFCCDTRLYTTDGTNSGTLEVINTRSYSSQYWVTNNRVVFEGYDPEHGEELFVSDGTASGTKLLKDINPTGNSSFSYHTLPGTYLYFSAQTQTGETLWRTDGTPDGTLQVANFDIGSFKAQFYVAGKFLYKLETPVEALTQELSVLQNSAFVPLATNVDYVKVRGEILYFIVPATSGNELWQSDGSVAGTQALKSVPEIDIEIAQVTDTKYLYYYQFPRVEGQSPTSMFRFDGTTHIKVDGLIGNHDLYESYSENGKTFIFTKSADVAADQALHFWDVSLSGKATLISQLAVTDIDFNAGFQLFKGKLIMSATTPTEGKEPWVSDGTNSGTRLLKDIIVGAESSEPFIGNSVFD